MTIKQKTIKFKNQIAILFITQQQLEELKMWQSVDDIAELICECKTEFINLNKSELSTTTIEILYSL
jgi:hypothetical protein